jgi:hypothetical protein
MSNDQGPTDEPTGGDADEGPITPEVVRRGAAARKRRPGSPDGGGDANDADEAPTPGGGRPMARGARPASGVMFRTGCMLLVAIGVLELFLGAQLVRDPDQARCTAARLQIDEANDDDETFNDVELPEGSEDADDVLCNDAIGLAADIPDDEDEPADGTFAEASTFRTQGIIVSVLGLAHGVTGFFTQRTRNRRWRTAALVFVAAGLFVPVLGIISMIVMAFVVFALLFSNDAKAIFGQTGGLFGPRPPRGAPS